MQISMLNTTPAQAAVPVSAPSSETVSAQIRSTPHTSTPVQQDSSRDIIKNEQHKANPEDHKTILKESTEKFNQMSEDLNLDVKFAYNDKIDQVYLNVIDKHTGRVIRKLPSEEAMKISESMKELVGALLDKRG